MAMPGSITTADRKKRIDDVIGYILAHPATEVSLETLAGLAHYSPFHLQKIFKEIIGESPKQYILKLRLEIALHLLIIHPHRPIQQIAADAGFSSPAVFSRAMRSYFGHSPGQLRELSHPQQMKILHAVNQKFPPAAAAASPALPGHPIIHIVKKDALNGIYRIAPFDDPGKIQGAFLELTRIARTREGATTEPVLYGILTPHQRNTYQAFLPLAPGEPALKRYPLTEIKSGLFAAVTVRGGLRQTNRAIHYFYRQWLPGSGYKIADITGFEAFAGSPASIPYAQLERVIHIPIEPAV
jgi:AraC family transcriptional regulator